jgi:hypothetical protein
MRRYGFALGMILSIGLIACGGNSTGVGSDSGTSDAAPKTDAAGVDEGSSDLQDDGGTCLALAAAVAALDIPPACATCMGASCCSELAVCEGDSACMNIALCVARCRGGGGTDESCVSECSSGTDATANTEINALGTCVGAHCSAPCE